MGQLEFCRQCAFDTSPIIWDTEKEEYAHTTSTTAGVSCTISQNHFIIKSESKWSRFHVCGRRTTYTCEKRAVALHPECFKLFHP